MGIRLDRLLAIAIKLLSRRRWTTQALATEFGVSSRTIYRDIQTLSVSGMPVISFQGQNGGWELDPDYVLDRRLLTADDIAHLISGLDALLQKNESEKLQKTLDKIKSLITPDKQSQIQTKLQHIVIDPQEWLARKKGQDTLKVVAQAIEDGYRIRFDYLNLKNEKSARTVEPMTLVLKGNSWYLFAFCTAKKDYRLFRLSRMFDTGQTPEPFTRKNQTYETYKPNCLFPEKQITLRLRFTKAIWVNIGDWLGFEQITWDGEVGRIQTTVPDGDWILSILLGFGSNVVVESPLRLAKQLQKTAIDLAKNYV
ncbi:MAG: helix-turn-helix transcriptional regulator [Candidatus Margulisiibacteriota bacterium]